MTLVLHKHKIAHWKHVLFTYGPRQANLVLSPMRAAMVQASLHIHTVSPEPPLLAHTSSESRGTFRQKARSLAPLNGWACAVKICHGGMLEDTNSLDASHIFVAERYSDSCSISLYLPVFRKKLDIQMILQLCGCLSATNIQVC